MKEFTQIDFICPITGDTYTALFASAEIMQKSVTKAIDKHGTSAGDSLFNYKGGKPCVEQLPVVESPEQFMQFLEAHAKEKTLAKLSDAEKELLGLNKPKPISEVTEAKIKPSEVVTHYINMGATRFTLCGFDTVTDERCLLQGDKNLFALSDNPCHLCDESLAGMREKLESPEVPATREKEFIFLMAMNGDVIRTGKETIKTLTERRFPANHPEHAEVFLFAESAKRGNFLPTMHNFIVCVKDGTE